LGEKRAVIRLRRILALAIRGILYATAVLIAIFALLVALWSFLPPVSTLMLARIVTGQEYQRIHVRLDQISPVALASIVTSEDARFCRHTGVDWDALRQVIADAGEDGPARGASTITMQTAKNLFLWPGRSRVRKGLEIGAATAIDAVWSKTHILEIYLNIAEWGDGVFGIEAAARRYFRKSASALNAREAALLATALPSPLRRDPSQPGSIHRRLAANLAVRTARSGAWLDCLPRRG